MKTNLRIPLGLALCFFLIAGTAPSNLAQQPAPAPDDRVPRIVDRSMGEEEQIRRRTEWFFSTRTAGTTSDADRASLRLAGVEQTRLRLLEQSARRSDGIEAEQNFWVSKGPSPSTFGGWAFGTVSGRIASIDADWAGGALYLGSASGGLWKSTNDGLSWTNLFDQVGTMTVGTVAVDPNDPNVIWAGTGENVTGCEGYFGIGLLRSADGGASWEARNGSGGDTLDDLSSFANIVIDPRDSDHVLTGGRIRGCAGGSGQSGGLYTSVDGGLTWTNRLSGLEIYEIAQDPAVYDVYWAGTSAGVYKSTDNGVTWTLQTASGLPNGSPGRTELAIAPSDGNTVYALFSGGPSFWRTTDGGATWTQMTSGSSACDGQCWYNMVVRVHRTDPNIVYRGTVHIFKSVDGGANWTDLSNNWGSSQKVHQDTHHFLMHPDQADTFYVGCDGGIWKTTDGGASFTNLNGNLNVTQFYAIGVDYSDPEAICGGAQDNSSLARTTDDVWDLQTVTGDGFVCHIDPMNPSYSYITSYPSGSYPSVYRSTTGILGSYSRITGAGSGIIPGDRSNWVTPYIPDPRNPSTLYLGTHRVYRSDDHGSLWTQVGPTDLTAGSGSLLSLEVNRSYPTYLFSGSASGRVWRSVNGGYDWTDITTGLPSRSINDIAGDPTDPERAFATVGGFNTAHVWEWTSAAGWTARDTGMPNVPANSVLMLTGNDIIVGTDTGVFRSYDGGATFAPYMNGLPEGTVVTDLKYNPVQNIVTAGTYGRGAWQVSVDPVQPIVVYDSIELPLAESDGDGDGNVEPGETWIVKPVLLNSGGQTAMDVTARLSTATPGVTVLEPSVRGYGPIDAGGTAPALTGYEFVVDPSFTCGAEIVFDLTEVASSNPPVAHADRPGAFHVAVVDTFQDPIPVTLVDEDFDPAPGGWPHEGFNPGFWNCQTIPYHDEWQTLSKDTEHGTSYHCGNGPGDTYSRYNYSWLYQGGKDSQGGAGLDIPSDAVAATLTLVHWYDTVSGRDGGQVVIDSIADGQDVYNPLEPDGGYPGGKLATGGCNGLEDKEAFQGSSGGWITSTFDLLEFKGRTVWLAFVFGSDNGFETAEGWYIDQVVVEYHQEGSPVCQATLWPGSVPATVRFDLLAGGSVEATWDDSCNAGSPAGQTYSIQAGDLDALHAGGAYTHVTAGAVCDRTSPATFTPGSGNEYYLVAPNQGGREGGAGAGSAGAPRPQGDALCGIPREAACP